VEGAGVDECDTAEAPRRAARCRSSASEADELSSRRYDVSSSSAPCSKSAEPALDSSSGHDADVVTATKTSGTCQLFLSAAAGPCSGDAAVFAVDSMTYLGSEAAKTLKLHA
jgi:hypothetical protein